MLKSRPAANLTGAGNGMKSEKRRNFEAGILTNERELIKAASEQFDAIWRGARCRECGWKEWCGDRVE